MMRRIKKQPAGGQRAFTLVETLLAVTILVISMSGPLTIAAKSLNSALFAKDQITAFYLAQESVEYLRNVRDINALNGRSSADPSSANYWLTGISHCINVQCTVQPTGASIASAIVACGGECAPLKYDSATGFYGYSSGEESQFTRYVTLEKVTDNEYSIISTVSWHGLVSSQFVVRENIFNWE